MFIYIIVFCEYFKVDKVIFCLFLIREKIDIDNLLIVIFMCYLDD